MNPNTGEVLAMANWPGFNPSDLQDATPDELENRATGFTYEPGSTFKAFTVASALSDHVVTPSSSFYLPSEIHVYDRTIGEAHDRAARVTLTTAQILAQSSNVGAVTIGLKEGARPLLAVDQPLRLRPADRPRATRVRSAASFPALKDYSGSTMGNLPIGQGLAVTPMQIATAYSAIADGGILRRPTLVKSVGGQPADENTDPHRVITRDVGPAPPDARGSARAGRHRVGRERPRLRAGGQDGYRAEGRERHLLRHPVRRLVRRLRARRPSEAAGRGGRRRAAVRPRRRRGRGAGLRPDRLVRAALPGDLARASLAGHWLAPRIASRWSWKSC